MTFLGIIKTYSTILLSVSIGHLLLGPFWSHVQSHVSYLQWITEALKEGFVGIEILAASVIVTFWLLLMSGWSSIPLRERYIPIIVLSGYLILSAGSVFEVNLRPLFLVYLLLLGITLSILIIERLEERK